MPVQLPQTPTKPGVLRRRFARSVSNGNRGRAIVKQRGFPLPVSHTSLNNPIGGMSLAGAGAGAVSRFRPPLIMFYH